MTAACTRHDTAPADAAHAFAGFYRQWSAWCHDAVLDTLDVMVHPAFIDRAAGRCLPATVHEALQQAWAAPCDRSRASGEPMLRPVLACLVMQAFGRDPREVPVAAALAGISHAASRMAHGIASDQPHQRLASGSAWLAACLERLARPAPGLDAETAARLVGALAWEHGVNGLENALAHRGTSLGGCDHASPPVAPPHGSWRLALEIGAIAGGAAPGQVLQLAAFGEALAQVEADAQSPLPQVQARLQALHFLRPVDRQRLAGFAQGLARLRPPPPDD